MALGGIHAYLFANTFRQFENKLEHDKLFLQLKRMGNENNKFIITHWSGTI